MFPWNFTKSAEAMLSRWAIKRICKFVLKKKLGDYLLGDINLDQLDVQLRQGTIQLSDLALNVDCINQKLDGSPVMVKEGSIASLSVKIPWMMKDCQIEVEELELVLAACKGRHATEGARTSDDDKCTTSSSEKAEKGFGGSTSVSLNVHEGVKTIAKIVKLILSSFNVRLKNVIIAFDPGSVSDEKEPGPSRSLVLRIDEMEYGTCVSDDVTRDSRLKSESLLGMTKLTNFIRFKEAVVELLELSDTCNKTQDSCSLGRSFNELYPENPPSGRSTRIIGGATRGFSGVLNMSIPWKNGSLDIRKLDADISIDPVKLSLQPKTIAWIISLWNSLKDIIEGNTFIQHKGTDSAFPKFKSQVSLATNGYSAPAATEKEVQSEGLFPADTYFPYGSETVTDAFMPGTHVIQNWVPFSADIEDHSEIDPDSGASIDQFFECFDGLRSSQGSLGNSGIWNWTCSVFSAITAASSLASGCDYVPSEKQNVETNVKAFVSAFSIVLSFHDEDEQKHSSDIVDNNQTMEDMHGTVFESFSAENIVDFSQNDSKAGFYMGSRSSMYIGSSTETCSCQTSRSILNTTCLGLSVVLQIFPQCTEFKAALKHIKIDHHFSHGAGGTFNCESDSHKMSLVHNLQAGVQDALPPFPFSAVDTEGLNASSSTLVPLLTTINGNINGRDASGNGLVKVTLFESFGDCCGEYSIGSTHLNDKSTMSTSFFLKLPPFIFWIDFHLVNRLMDLSKQVENSFVITGPKEYESDFTKTHDDNKNIKDGTCTQTTNNSGKLQGDIVLPNARFILCFTSQSKSGAHELYCWDRFIAVEFSSYPSIEKIKCGIPNSAKKSCGQSFSASTSISLYNGNIDVHLVTTANEKSSVGVPQVVDNQLFLANKILFANCGGDHHATHAGVEMVWQEGPVTGPWIAKSALNLAGQQNPRSKTKVTGKGFEFASVTTAEDRGEANSHARQEMVLSSSFLLHVHLSLVYVNLMQHEYELLSVLLEQLLEVVKQCSHDKFTTHEQPVAGSSCTSQSSILVEFDNLELCINVEEVEETSSSLQKELPGSWNKFKLKAENFELLSVSDIGGLCGANFFWLKHGEGELWGSIPDISGPSAVSHDFLLITCKDSTLKRGNGEGGNVISYGSAGTSITHFHNPEALQGCTSVNVQCGTIIAPGCRLDWVNTIKSFFTLCSSNTERNDSPKQSQTSVDDVKYKTSFFLELIDVALSYEPHVTGVKFPNSDQNSTDLEEAPCQQHVSCLLAAASLNLSNQAFDDSASDDLIIQLQDIGFLIGLWSESKSERRYDVAYLRNAGYVKVAGDALVKSVLKTHCEEDLLWEVEFSDLNVRLDTCHDTTFGLIRLIEQLQQHFAPDVEDALVHLQSRWSSTKQTHGVIGGSTVSGSSSISNEGCESNCSGGVMDDVLDDFFDLQEKQQFLSDSCNTLNEVSDSKNMAGDRLSNSRHQIVDEVCSLNDSSGGTETSSLGRTSISEFIESNYMTDLYLKPEVTARSRPYDEVPKIDASSLRGSEGGKGGWYGNDLLTIDENHLSDVVYAHKVKHQDPKFSSVHSCSSEACKPKGRIRLTNTDIRWKMFGGFDWPHARKSSSSSQLPSHRDEDACLELQLSGLSVQHDMYPEGETFVSRLSLSVQDFHLHDNSKDAPWKMVLGYYHSKHRTRESCAKAFKLELESVRPDPFIPLEEYRLYLALLPMRLHLDQSQLNFLVDFFGGSSVKEYPECQKDLGPQGKSVSRKEIVVEEALLPFFQKCDIRPVVLRVDYVPRNIDLAALSGGDYIQLINLVPWKGIDLQLKHVHAVGVYGWGGICGSVAGEWLEDISQNQVHKLLKGLKPVNSLVSISSGATKMISLPIKDYKKDSKLIKGIQRGAITFLKSVSLEAVGLGVHLAAGAHEILLQTECALANTKPARGSSERSRRKASIRSNQPRNARQGIEQAYESLSDGISRTASALVGNPLKTYHRGAGAGSALGSAIRAAPSAIITPASSTARAVHCALLGVRNSLDSEHKYESIEKYLGSTQAQDRR